ncbi:MAG: glycerol-3-phosphate dehydrogenase/oxidase [Parachlamydiales bacterium]|nr:glycerol-3-phosphate dehydrogenase/oxidase [Parachlamydiales bacterium]
MNRDQMLRALKTTKEWDIAVVGGGATGLGIAVDAASRGFSTVLLEQSDFAKATSSRSTKLIHGGVRYLKQGNVGLVIEALKERGLLCQNAPHLVHHLPFLVPSYHWWEGPFYGIGLKVYDLLAGKLGIEKSKHLSREEVLEKLPTLEPKDLRGGTIYYDGQFDDARLAIVLAQTAAKHGACILNYTKVTGLIKEGPLVKGVIAEPDIEIRAKVVINATGVFADGLRKMDGQKNSSIIEPSQGVHLVLDRSFLSSDTAIMIPHTDDGRVLFFVPWLDHVLVGTTDTPVKNILLEPKPLEEEIEFLLTHAKKYLTKHPERKDILSVFAGLRPLVRSGSESNTAALSRDHVILISDSGLITIAGGKWTTYRKMAEDAVNKAILVGHLDEAPCSTETLPLHNSGPIGHGEKPLHPQLTLTPAHIIRAVNEEMALTLEDVLARRTRSLFLNAKASIEIAEKAAHIMAKALGKSAAWEKEETASFIAIAKTYAAIL